MNKQIRTAAENPFHGTVLEKDHSEGPVLVEGETIIENPNANLENTNNQENIVDS